MKRGWFGAGLLLVLLALGITSSVLMQNFHKPLSQQLEQAGEYALEENWEKAVKIAESAEETWRKLWHFSAAVSDHEPMEQIDSLFAQLEIYRKAGDCLGFANTCASLSRQVEAMGDAHKLSWWNLL